MFQYIKPTSYFDLVKNFGMKLGDGLVRLGPDTNCEFVCEEVTEEGVPISGCHGLDSCVLETIEVPCIGEVADCDPCSCAGAAAGGDTGAGEGITVEEVTAIAVQAATDCNADSAAKLAELKAAQEATEKAVKAATKKG